MRFISFPPPPLPHRSVRFCLDKNVTLPLRCRWRCALDQDGRSSNAAAGLHLQVARYNERKGHASPDTECPGDRVVRPSSDVMQIKSLFRSVIQSGDMFYVSMVFIRNIKWVSGKWPTWRTIPLFYNRLHLLQSSTSFEQRRAHHQEVKLY